MSTCDDAEEIIILKFCVITNIIKSSEIKMIATVNVSELQKTADIISKEIRTLDNLLQSTNWTVDLIEY